MKYMASVITVILPWLVTKQQILKEKSIIWATQKHILLETMGCSMVDMKQGR